MNVAAAQLETRLTRDPGSRATLWVAGAATHRQATKLRQRLLDALSNGIRHLRVDLSEIDAMDTAALAVLVEVLLFASSKNLRIDLCQPSEEADKVLQLAAFVRMNSTFPDRELDLALSRCRCADQPRARP